MFFFVVMIDVLILLLVVFEHISPDISLHFFCRLFRSSVPRTSRYRVAARFNSGTFARDYNT